MILWAIWTVVFWGLVIFLWGLAAHTVLRDVAHPRWRDVVFAIWGAPMLVGIDFLEEWAATPSPYRRVWVLVREVFWWAFVVWNFWTGIGSNPMSMQWALGVFTAFVTLRAYVFFLGVIHGGGPKWPLKAG